MLVKYAHGMAEQVNVYEAKTQLSKLLERVEAGDEIVIARNGRPVAKLVPLQRSAEPRVLGALRGKIWIAPDFDAEDDEINALFYDAPLTSEPLDRP